MKRWLALLLLAGCVEDDFCPLITSPDAFQLVLSSETWPSGQYSIEVSYADSVGMACFECFVPIPALPQLDAGSLPPDAGVDARGNFSCRPKEGCPSARRAGGQAGQEIELGFEGTPASAHLKVSNAGQPVLEQDVALSYGIARPYGDSCPGPLRAAVRIELPQ